MWVQFLKWYITKKGRLNALCSVMQCCSTHLTLKVLFLNGPLMPHNDPSPCTYYLPVMLLLPIVTSHHTWQWQLMTGATIFKLITSIFYIFLSILFSNHPYFRFIFAILLFNCPVYGPIFFLFNTFPFGLHYFLFFNLLPLHSNFFLS